MNKFKRLTLTLIFSIAITAATQTTINAQAIEFDYDFHQGTLGWEAGFADYPPYTDPDNSLYELYAGLRYLPRKLTRVPKRGFYFQGSNRSDDLFMFLKRRLSVKDGITPNRTYRLEYVITLASSAPSGCGGIGGQPGESVYLKVAGSSIEPLAVLQSNGFLRMNVDIGSQSNSGAAATVAGNIANGIPCSQSLPYYPSVFIERSRQHASNITANSNGELWLLVGTDSGFEGKTWFYYQKIRVKLIPV